MRENAGPGPLDLTKTAPMRIQGHEYYARIICCLRDDLQREQANENKCLPDNQLLTQVVACEFGKDLFAMGWEEATVRLLQAVRQKYSADTLLHRFADAALARMRRVCNVDSIWLH